MNPALDAAHLDILALAQAGAQLQGHSPLSQWPRLLAENQGAPDTDVHWQLQGRLQQVTGASPQVWVDLQARVILRQTCQRCLTPTDTELNARQSLRFVADEATAAALDDEMDEDVLVWSRDFNALELIEDELILSLPLVPAHDQCPSALPRQAADPEALVPEPARNPFAALASLKKKD